MPKRKRTSKKQTCGLGQTSVPKSCGWKMRTFKHGDKRPWGGQFITGKDDRATKRWYVLMGPDGDHRQFFQKCLATRVRAAMCTRESGK